jgi:hypothetical protein
VAVGTQQSKVVQRVVLMVAVYVVQFQRNGLIHPGIELAIGAPPLEDFFVNKSPAQPVRLNWILV